MLERTFLEAGPFPASFLPRLRLEPVFEPARVFGAVGRMGREFEAIRRGGAVC